MKHRISLKEFFWTAAFFLVFSLTIFGWWNSSRYSERHLIYIGPGTIEIFSSSSLLRISLVPGKVGDLGSKTFYRQKNARGKMLFRPAFPTFHRRSGLLEITLGYWHLAIFCVILTGLSGFFELSARRSRREGGKGRN